MTTDTMPVDVREELEACKTRDDVASIYATLILYNYKGPWRPINEYILTRWSEAGLEYIKKQAWAQAENCQDGART